MTDYQELKISESRIKTLTVNECAEATGIGQHAIRTMTNNPESEFPFFKVGTRILIPVIALEEWLLKASSEKKCL